MTASTCELCANPGGEILWRDALARIVWIHDAQHPAFMRVIWNQHVKEMTDLAPSEGAHLMELVFRTERALRDCLQPHKINLASLGNKVAHLHWHVIPRFVDDPHFPDPIWATATRSGAHVLNDPEAFRNSLIKKLTDF